MDDEQLDFGDDGEEDLHYGGEDDAEDVDDENEEGYDADATGEAIDDYDAEDDGLAALCKCSMQKKYSNCSMPHHAAPELPVVEVLWQQVFVCCPVLPGDEDMEDAHDGAPPVNGNHSDDQQQQQGEQQAAAGPDDQQQEHKDSKGGKKIIDLTKPSNRVSLQLLCLRVSALVHQHVEID